MSPLTTTNAGKRKRSTVRDMEGYSKDQKDVRTGVKKKVKGKSREAEGEFTTVNATLPVSIAPVFASNPRMGVEELLDSMVMRCVKYHLARERDRTVIANINTT